MIRDFLQQYWLHITAVVLLIITVNALTKDQNQSEIFSIQKELRDTKEENDQLSRDVAKKDQQIAQLETDLEENQAEIDGYLESIAAKEAELIKIREESHEVRMDARLLLGANKQLTVFVDAFPEFAKAKDFGTMKVQSGNLVIDYVTFPLDLLNHFVVLKNEHTSQLVQIDTHREIEEQYGEAVVLYEENQSLRAKIVQLETEKYAACDGVRQKLNARYISRAEAHIETLKEPRINLGNKWAFGGGMVVGGVGCGLITGKIKF